MARRVTILVLPEAVADLQAAASYYREVEGGFVERFRLDLQGVFERLAVFPNSGRPVVGVGQVRRARMRRFPYGVFYTATRPGEIRVVRVLHDRRDLGTTSSQE